MASDLISRSTLLKAMDERYKEIETEKQYPFASDEERGLTAGFCEVDELVNNQPTVDAVEVVHGEWIYWGKDVWRQCKCSECLTSYGCIDTPYCPHCGAKMDGGDK